MKSAIITALCVLPTLSWTAAASELDIPNSFSAGATAVAADVNANFTAVETSVDDNFAQIVDLQSQVQTLEDQVDDLNDEIDSLEAQLDPATHSSIARVVFPRQRVANFTDYSSTGNRGVFRIQFNMKMDTASFVAGSNVTVTGDGGTGSGVIGWEHSDSTMIYTMDQDFISIATCFTGGLFLTIQGDGANAVLDAQGLPFDGDNDGLRGGDFTVNFDTIC